MKYNHMLDVAFTIETDVEDPGDLTPADITAALLRRVASLVEDPQSNDLIVGGAIGHCDTFEIEEEDAPPIPMSLREVMGTIQDAKNDSCGIAGAAEYIFERGLRKQQS